MAKCILLIRVSTKQQNYEAQKSDLIRFATKIYNYNVEDLIYIENKESAIKLSEEEREGISEAKKRIEEDNRINCVFAWEISRVGRRSDVINSFRDFLIAHNVNLRLYHEGVSLLNEDGSVNRSGNLIVDVASDIAVYEMETKMARIKRDRAKKVIEGKTATGRVLYGYKIDENGYVMKDDIGDEASAPRVAQIFDWSLSGKSATWIWEECVDRGWFSYKTRLRGKNYILNILAQPAYCGRPGYKTQTKYPPIISEETFEKVKTGKKKRISEPKTYTSKIITYGKGLVKYITEDDMEYAMCQGHSRNSYRMTNPEMKSVSISMNVIDHILWTEAMHLYTHFLVGEGEKTLQRLRQEKRIAEGKMAASDKIRKDISAQMERKGQRYDAGYMTFEKYDSEMKALLRDDKHQIEQMTLMTETIARIDKQIREIGSDEWAVIDPNSIAGIESDKEKFEIIHKVIDKVYVRKYGLTDNGDQLYKIQVDQHIHLIYNRYYVYWSRGGVFHLELHIVRLDGRELIEDVSSNIVRRYQSDWSLRNSKQKRA